MGITIRGGPDVLVSVSGDIDYARGIELRDAVQRLLDDGRSAVRLDLSGVGAMDFGAARMLAEYGRESFSRGERRVQLQSASPVVRSMILRFGVAELLNAGGVLPEPYFPSCASESVAGESTLCSFSVAVNSSAPHLVRDRIERSLRDVLLSDAERTDVTLAVGEAVANAVRHGSSGVEGSVGVVCSVDASRLTILVSDSGPGFDPDAVRPPDFAALPTGGMGIAIMRMVMDEVSFDCSRGTTVRMVKRLDSRG